MNNQLTRRAGFREALPIALSYFGICLALGIVSRAAGVATWLVVLMSAFIYAGSAQFVIVSMLATQAPLLSIVAAAFLVNARLILLSITLAPHFPEKNLRHDVLMASLLTDESFALGLSKSNETRGRLNFAWFHSAALLPYITAVVATGIGAQLGNLLTNPERFGVDFAVVAMFIGLVYLQLITDRQYPQRLQLLLIVTTLIMIYFGLIFIPARVLILVVTLIGCAIGVFLKHVYF